MKPPKLGEMRWSIRIMRRSMRPPAPFEGAAGHDYEPFLTTRAACKTNGLTEFSRVMVNGVQATHTFTIRWPSIPVDIRDKIQDVHRNLYTILSVDPVDEGRRWMRLHCSRGGSIDQPVVN
jgi:SPP1 family predicted phage head-tail adaptor